MQKITDEMIGELFTTMKLSNDEERTIYNEKYIKAQEGTTEHDLYEMVSNIAYKSGMSFEFSYRVISKACGVVSQYLLNSDGDDDNIHELVDNAVPIYNHELMQIYVSDWSIVDEAHDELVGNEDDSVGRAQVAWYYILERVTREIIGAVSEYNDAE